MDRTGPAETKNPEETSEIIRKRALLLGLALALAICALTPFNNAYRQGTPLGGGHFPLAPFFIAIWLFVFSAVGARLSGRRALLTGREILVVWVMMVLVSGIAWTGLARTFFINLTAPFHFATVGNHWAEVLQPLVPEAWVPGGAAVIEGLYNGIPGGRSMTWGQVFSEIPWGAWVRPLSAFSVLILLAYFVMLCLANLLSRQWLHNERMNFPLLRVPEMMEKAMDGKGLGRFFSNRFLLAGLSIPFFLHLLNGLHFYYPEVPQLPTLILAGPYFPKQGLFSGFTKLKIFIYPAFVGFAFLTSKQISLSFWLFFILGGLLVGALSVMGYSIPAAALGVTFGPTLARPEEVQMIGAAGIFFVFILWLARFHLKDLGQNAFRFGQKEIWHTEWFSPRLSFWGFFLGSFAIMVWARWFGVPMWLSFLLIGAFFMVMLVATRVICQGGIAYFTLTAAPIDGLTAVLGSSAFSGASVLVAAVMQKVLFVDLRECLMPSLIHASQITHNRRNKGLLLAAMVILLVSAVAVSFMAMLALCYKFGVRELELDWATRTSVAVYDNVYAMIEAPAATSGWVTFFIGVGALVMLSLVACYHRLYWWPIHPIGYLTAYSSAMRILWFSFFLGWLANALCMRYGGVLTFKKLRYFFVGLIIGDFLMGGAWALVGFFSDASYQVLPS